MWLLGLQDRLANNDLPSKIDSNLQMNEYK